ncbi:MAG: hypothetical protein ACREAN_07235, partial [Nitrosopumilaceae archaeon]
SMLSTTFMIAQESVTPKLSDPVGYLGHVTYVVRGPDGNIKSYVQTDNSRTVTGQLCGLNALFQPTAIKPAAGGGNTTTCDIGRISQFNGYNVIGLINGSSTITLNGSDTYTTSKLGCTTTCRASANDGIIPVTAAANEGAPALGTVAAGSTYNSITITSPSFTFSNLKAAGTTIRGSVLLNATSGTAPSIFAENQASPVVTVGSGDTLTVTWNVSLS